MRPRPITLLWAVRSPCNLGCRYCYFGTVEEHRVARPAATGTLSHLSPDDLTADEALAFAETLADSAVGRVFLAGGEPLIWPPTLDLIAVLRTAGIETVVCTNGVPLNNPAVVESLLARGVDAVSISLDSARPAHNDTWRPGRDGRGSWVNVLAGVQALLLARDAAGPGPVVGIYSVITRRNIDDVTAVPALAADLGCDYSVVQPVALAAEHPLHDELSLRPPDLPHLETAFAELYANRAGPRLPAPTYPAKVTAAVRDEVGVVAGCFGGHTLFFVEPDGSVWDCPSSLRIAATPAGGRRTVRTATASELFGPPQGQPHDCALFSRDCVNMWPLMDFGVFLPDPAAAIEKTP